MNSPNLLSAMLPAHAALAQLLEHRAAGRPGEISREVVGEILLILGKYIIVERNGTELPIVFSRDFQHSEVLTLKSGRPVSAGFYQFFAPDKIIVSGESTTIGMGLSPARCRAYPPPLVISAMNTFLVKREGKIHSTVDGRPVCGGGNGARKAQWQIDIGPSTCVRCNQIANRKIARNSPPPIRSAAAV